MGHEVYHGDYFANNLIMICWSKFGQQIVTLFLAQNGASPTHDTHETSPLKSNLKTNGGGQVDYKKVSIKWLPIRKLEMRHLPISSFGRSLRRRTLD